MISLEGVSFCNEKPWIDSPSPIIFYGVSLKIVFPHGTASIAQLKTFVTEACYTLFASNNENWWNNKPCAKHEECVENNSSWFVSVSQKTFLQNAFAGVGGLLMNIKYFYRCNDGYLWTKFKIAKTADNDE